MQVFFEKILLKSNINYSYALCRYNIYIMLVNNSYYIHLYKLGKYIGKHEETTYICIFIYRFCNLSLLR